VRRAELRRAVQSRVARIAVGASAVRGRGNAGAVAAARRHLRHVDLAKFGVKRAAAFRRALNQETKALLAALPRGARHWGIARKLLNIFLRDCLYTTYLESDYHLSRAEEAFEIPLDSITALQLKRLSGRGSLPRWPGVKHLTPSLSAQFQEAASVEAARRGIARVHMDAVWWSQSRDDDAVQ
jgi:hypothetical protein